MTEVLVPVESGGGSDEVALDAANRWSVRRLLQRGLRPLIVGGIVVGIVLLTVENWSEVVVAVRSVSSLSLVLAFAMTCVGIFAGVRVWHVVLQEMGSSLTFRRAAEVNLVGLLGKYLPGSVWAYALQTELSRRAGVPRARAFVALLVATGVSAVTAFAMAPLSLPLVDRPLVRLALTLAPLALITLVPAVLGIIVRTALTLLRRPQPELRFTWRTVRRAAGWAFVTWACFGTQLWVLASSVGDIGHGAWVLSTSAMALAMTLGFLAFVAPSGLGVREAFIVAVLAPVMTPGAALGIALLSRFLFMCADLLCAGGSTLVARREMRSSAAVPPAEVDVIPDHPAA